MIDQTKKDDVTTWKADTELPEFSPLAEARSVDVAIIGAGITGLTTAYLLSKQGKKVAVLEKEDDVGGFATSRTTAIITRSIDMDTPQLISSMGEEDAALILNSHQHAIDVIEKIITDEKIGCEFMRDTNYIYANTEKDLSSLQEESDSLEQLHIATELSQTPLKGFSNAGYQATPNQAKFHPLKYLVGMIEVLTKQGVEIYTKSEVTHIERPTEDSGTYVLATGNGTVTAMHVFSATHLPFEEHQPLSLYFRKALYSTYMMEVALPSGTIEEGTYEDTGNPYNYFRIDAGKGPEGKDRMIVGGADHRTDIPVNHDKSFAALEEYVSNIMPDTELTILRKWTGPIVEPTDGLAFIGPAKKGERLYYATGYSGNGMTHGTLAAEIITDLILGVENKYAAPYQAFSTKRTFFKGLDYVAELAGGAVKNTIEQDHKEVEGKAENEI